MRNGHRYLLGVAAVAATTALLALALPREARAGVWLALGLALAAQGPLGWWLVGALGSDRFFLAWAVGIAARFALVAACALVVVPGLGVPPGPILIALVGVLMSFVAVEAIAVQPRGNR